jgi:hypothetical protein
MSQQSKWLQEKALMGWKIKSEKGKPADYSKQVSTMKSLMDMEKSASDEKKNPTLAAAAEHFKKPRHERGENEDLMHETFSRISREKSIVDDKERMAKYKTGMAKLHSMVESSNERLYTEEREDFAQKKITPRVNAYLEQSKTMTPDSRIAFLQRTMDDYNNAAGTDYRVLAVDGMEPWKATMSDAGKETEVVDLMSFIQNDQEKQYELFMKSNEIQGMEQQMQREDALETKKSQLAVKKDERLMAKEQEFDKTEQYVKETTGDSVRAIERFADSSSITKMIDQRYNNTIKEADTAAEVIGIINDLDKIIKNNPDLYKKVGSAYFENVIKNPTEANKIASRVLSSRKDREDLTVWAKSIGKLLPLRMSGVPAKAMNMYLEKIIQQSIANPNNVPEANLKLNADMRKAAEHIYNEGLKTYKYMEEGLEYRPKIKGLEIAQPESAKPDVGATTDTVTITINGQKKKFSRKDATLALELAKKEDPNAVMQ